MIIEKKDRYQRPSCRYNNQRKFCFAGQNLCWFLWHHDRLWWILKENQTCPSHFHELKRRKVLIILFSKEQRMMRQNNSIQTNIRYEETEENKNSSNLFGQLKWFIPSIVRRTMHRAVTTTKWSFVRSFVKYHICSVGTSITYTYI